MKHYTACSRQPNLDVEIRFTKIGHTKVEQWVISLEILLWKIPNRELKSFITFFRVSASKNGFEYANLPRYKT